MSRSVWAPSPGHIVRAAVQFSDSEQTKSRFPVVVSSDEFNQAYPELIVAFTTREKNVHHVRSYDVVISERHSSFRETGLRESTMVRCGRLWTLDKRKIEDVIGLLPSDILADVIRLVRECFNSVH
jgi:mRNA-degrading endonuclease toxin of MazEF toxin-antitoxin module